MRWKSEQVFELDTRYVKRFAFFPVLLNNGDYVWFEYYYQKYRYMEHGYTGRFKEGKPEGFGSMVNGGLFYEDGCAKTKEELYEEIDNFYRKQKEHGNYSIITKQDQ